MDYGTLAAIYLICGFAFGLWFTYHMFKGGQNSNYYQQARKKHAGIDALNPWIVYFGAAVAVIVYTIAWPYTLTVNLIAEYRSRRDAAPLYLHPRLAKLRTQLTGHEDQYEEILTKFGLEEVVTALHAIDLPAAVDYGLDAVARTHALPERPTADVFEAATYANVIKVAITYTEMMALDSAKNRAKLQQAMALGRDLEKRFDHIRNPGINIGSLIAFRIHGWAPLSGLTKVKEMYSRHLKPEFNNADHIGAIFAGIRVLDDRDVTRVTVKGSDLSGEEYEQIVEEHLTKRSPRGPDAN
jgi:hypothetical protein